MSNPTRLHQARIVSATDPTDPLTAALWLVRTGETAATRGVVGAAPGLLRQCQMIPPTTAAAAMALVPNHCQLLRTKERPA